ncbi:MAG: putative manganese transporter [Massilibacteroides sp.]|nr:putative manganese transporter [Massilibacteroides sp.]
MLRDIIEIILSCAENAFLQVGVFVGAVLLIFGYINYKREGGFVRSLENSKRWQPVIGSMLGLSPGCGGAIFVMPLYLKGTVTFGTVIATLIATMGDSAFVLMSTLPKEYLLVSAVSIVVAIVSGYIVDKLKIDSRFSKRKQKLLNELGEKKQEHAQLENALINKGVHSECMCHIGHSEGDEIDIFLHHGKKDREETESSFAHSFTHKVAYKIFWVLTTIGLILGILMLCQIDVNISLKIPHLGTILGIGGTLFSVIYMIVNKKVLKSDSHEEEESKVFSLKETLIHNAEDTAFVNTWVFVAYVIYEIAVYAVGGEVVVKDWMLATGMASVFIGAAIGLIPGCGPQIIFVTLYTKGMLPFAALLANALSQDGDALFPLLAIDKKSSLLATVITTIPALIVGVIVYLIFNT